MKTYFLAEQPVILIICDSPEKKWQLKKQLTGEDTTVEAMSVAEFLAIQSEYDQKRLYKIMWIIDRKNKQNDDLIPLLQQSVVPIITVCSVITPLKKDDHALFNLIISESNIQQQVIDYVREKLPSTQIVVVRDVLEDLTLLFQQITQKIEKNTVLDPELVLYPITFQVVAQHLKQLLFRPAKGKTTLIQGSVIESKNFILETQRQFVATFANSWKIQQSPLDQENSFPFHIDQTIIEKEKLEKNFAATLFSVCQNKWNSHQHIPQPHHIPQQKEEVPDHPTLASVFGEVIPNFESPEQNYEVVNTTFEPQVEVTEPPQEKNNDQSTDQLVEPIAVQTPPETVITTTLKPNLELYQTQNLISNDIKRKIEIRQQKQIVSQSLNRFKEHRQLEVPVETVRISVTETPISTPTLSQILSTDNNESILSSYKENIERIKPADEITKITEVTVIEDKKIIEVKQTEIVNEKDLSNEIQRIFDEPRFQGKIKVFKQKATDQKKITKKSKRRKIVFIAGLVFVGIGLGILTLIGVFFWTSNSLQGKLLAIASAYEPEKSVEQFIADADINGLKKQQKIVSVQVNSYNAIFTSGFIDDTNNLVYLADEIIKAQSSMAELSELRKKAVQQFMGKEVGDMTVIVESLSLKAQEASSITALIEEKIKLVSDESNSAETEAKILALQESLTEFRNSTAELQAVLPLMSDLSGVNGKRVYAVLLQNNQELRPTGGFIQAVGLLTFENGSLINQQVYSSYDQALLSKIQIIPPPKVTELLQEQQWFIRDANWDPHFPATTAEIKKFIENSVGVQIDGVIGLDGYAVEEILEQVGPVDLPEYGEVITNRNFFERMEFHSDAVLVDKGKFQDHSQIFMTALLQKLSTLSEDKVNGFVSALGTSLQQQHMLVSLINPQEQQTIQGFGWTGEVLQPSCPSPLNSRTCVVDSYMQVEANIGVNKANYYVQRQNEHLIVLDKNEAVHQRKITFVNSAKSNSWPKGSYRSYIRFYLSSQSELDTVTIDGQIILPEAISLEEYLGRKVVGIQMDLPIQTSKVVTLNYRTKLPQNTHFSYVFFDQKQSGLSTTPLKLTVQHESSLIPTLLSPQGDVTSNGIVFEKIQNSHLLFGLQFDE